MAREPVGGGSDERTQIALGGQTREIARKLGEIDFDDLVREAQDIGGHVIWYGILHARAMKEVGLAKLRADVVEGTTARSLRRERTTNGEKVTDKIIEEETELHRDVIAAKEALIDAEERANIMKSVAVSQEQKHRMLTSLTGAIAREMGANTAPDDTLRALQRGRMGSRRAVN